MQRGITSWPHLAGTSLVLLVLIATLGWPGAVVGWAQTKERSVPEGPAPDWYENPAPMQPGFPALLSGSPVEWLGSPTLVDLDGNGTLEIVTGGRGRSGNQVTCSGMVYAYRSDGSLMWEALVRAPVNSAPTAADLNGDGHPDIIAGMGGLPLGQCWDGGIVALDGLTGAELWHFDTQDWLECRHDGMLDGVISTPAVGDVNGDGELEIIFGAWDQCFYLLDRNGLPLWGNLPGILPEVYCGGHGYYNQDTIWSSPALADLTGDGLPEIIIGADIFTGNVWGDPIGGYVYVFDANGTALAREWLDQDVYSSPAIVDLENDGDLEVVVGTGLYVDGAGYYVSAYDYDPNGAGATDRLVLRWRADTAGKVFASPAIGDLDGNGLPDVAIVSLTGDNGADGSIAYGLRGIDGEVLWQRRVCDMWGESWETLSSPVISDVDGDDRPEVLLLDGWEVMILNHDGTYYTDYSNPLGGSPSHPGCQRTHQPTTELSYWAQAMLWATPAVGDLDADGDVEIVAVGETPGNPVQGALFAWTGHPSEEWPIWPMFHLNEQHTGLYLSDPIPPTNPTSLTSPSHAPGVWSTNNVVQVAWSGAGDQGSGVAGYSIAWDTSATTLPDKVLDLPANASDTMSPVLPDGQSHYFHLRTADRAGNWTPGAVHLGPFWIDTGLPISGARSPKLVTGAFAVNWRGHDGGSGVLDYSVEVRRDAGPWTTWLSHVTGTSATYDQATAGHTYRFRSIARDRAGHVETAYSGAGDTATIVARYLVSGRVRDARGQPVSGAEVSAEPAALNRAATTVDGGYTLGVPDGGGYEITAGAFGFGPLPPRRVQVQANVTGLDFYLPPEENVVQNGGFEAAGGWTVEGPVPPARVVGAGFSGDYALKVGELGNLAGAPQATYTWSAAQAVTVPARGGSVLAWTYRVEGNAGARDQLTAIADGPGSDLTQAMSLEAGAWTHGWLDLRPLAGQPVTVRFVLTRDSPSGTLSVWLDDVSAGFSAYRVFVPQVDRRKH